MDQIWQRSKKCTKTASVTPSPVLPGTSTGKRRCPADLSPPTHDKTIDYRLYYRLTVRPKKYTQLSMHQRKTKVSATNCKKPTSLSFDAHSQRGFGLLRQIQHRLEHVKEVSHCFAHRRQHVNLFRLFDDLERIEGIHLKLHVAGGGLQIHLCV